MYTDVDHVLALCGCMHRSCSHSALHRCGATYKIGMQANRPLRELREVAKGITKQLPEPVQDASAKIDEYARGMIAGKRSTLFEELGLYYIGPVDGHNLSGTCENKLHIRAGFQLFLAERACCD